MGRMDRLAGGVVVHAVQDFQARVHELIDREHAFATLAELDGRCFTMTQQLSLPQYSAATMVGARGRGARVSTAAFCIVLMMGLTAAACSDEDYETQPPALRTTELDSVLQQVGLHSIEWVSAFPGIKDRARAYRSET